MKRFGIPFEEIRINLRDQDRKAKIFAHSPSGKVPALYAGELMIWDSLAIMEYLADRHPECAFWPEDAEARAIARSVSSEMHSGFQALRQQCPMDFLNVKHMTEFDEVLTLNIRRIVKLWMDCRSRYGGHGDFLFSEFSIADAMYAPVASRFHTYVADLTAFGDDGTAQSYVEAVLAMPEMRAWGKAAEQEKQPA